ncbi:MAG: hypothetical protein BWY78_00875 [Alphaproteobacteria bacterium ADurb.Bin438]|nr:MAG: hypothetical protein BWY78_00875 [Alphaproteobacteria bacterium ADurb.Bin438]
MRNVKLSSFVVALASFVFIGGKAYSSMLLPQPSIILPIIDTETEAERAERERQEALYNQAKALQRDIAANRAAADELYESLDEDINYKSSKKIADMWVQTFDYEQRRLVYDGTSGSNSSTSQGETSSEYAEKVTAKNMEEITEDYEKLNQIYEESLNDYENFCGGLGSGTSASEVCEEILSDVNYIEKKIDDIKKVAESVFYDNSAVSGYVWLTKDAEKLVRLEGVKNRTIEKNLEMVDQVEEINEVILRLGPAAKAGRFSPTFYSGAVNDMTAKVREKICTDSLLIAADKSAKMAAQVYGEMLLPYKLPEKQEDVKLLKQLRDERYKHEISYSIAISNYNLNRIAKETEEKIESYKKAASEVGSQSQAISVNTAILAGIAGEVIPLIVNTATSNTLDAIIGVRKVPNVNVYIK